jgi:chorismate mutase
VLGTLDDQLKNMTENALPELRHAIDNIDSAILPTLAERMRVIMQVATFKKSHNVPLDYSEARKADLKKTLDFAVSQNLEKAFIQSLFKTLYDESLRLMQIAQGIALPNNASLKSLNESLFSLDMALCALLSERTRLVKNVGDYKKANDLPVFVPDRWHAVLHARGELAKTLGISEAFVVDVFEQIHTEALRLERH